MIKTINFDEIPHAYWIKNILHPNPPSLERKLEKIARNEFGINLKIETCPIKVSDYLETIDKNFYNELQNLFGDYESIWDFQEVFRESEYINKIRDMNEAIFETNMSGIQTATIICPYGFFFKGVSYPPRRGGPFYSNDEYKQANIEFIIS